jgi:hypothetical protein
MQARYQAAPRPVDPPSIAPRRRLTVGSCAERAQGLEAARQFFQGRQDFVGLS